MEEIRNEEMNNETMVEENTTDLVPQNDYEPIEEEEGSIVPVVIGGLLIAGAAAGIGLGWKKIKAHSEKRQLKKLEKKGYTIIPPDSYEEDVVEAEEVSEENVSEPKAKK